MEDAPSGASSKLFNQAVGARGSQGGRPNKSRSSSGEKRGHRASSKDKDGGKPGRKKTRADGAIVEELKVSSDLHTAGAPWRGSNGRGGRPRVEREHHAKPEAARAAPGTARGRPLYPDKASSTGDAAGGGGAGAASGAGAGGSEDSPSAKTRYTLSSASDLPPGWDVMGVDFPFIWRDFRGGSCRVVSMRHGEKMSVTLSASNDRLIQRADLHEGVASFVWFTRFNFGAGSFLSQFSASHQLPCVQRVAGRL